MSAPSRALERQPDAPDEEGEDGGHANIEAENVVPQILAPSLVDRIDEAVAADESTVEPDALDAVPLSSDVVSELSNELELTASSPLVAKEAVMDRSGANPTVRAVGREVVHASHNELGEDKVLGSYSAIVEELDREGLGRAAEDEGVVGEGFARGAVQSALVVGVPVGSVGDDKGRSSDVGGGGEEGGADEEGEGEQPGEEEERSDDPPARGDGVQEAVEEAFNFG